MRKMLVVFLILSLTSCSFTGNLSSTQDSTNKANAENKEPEKLKNTPVSKVQVTSGDNIVVNQGDKIELLANVIYEDNSRDSAVSWSSSDSTIATVNPTNGALSGVKAGITTVTAISLKDTSKKSSSVVTVKKPEVVEAITKIDPKEATLKIGDTLRLDAKIQLSDGTLSPNIVWKSDNEGIALISNSLVTAIGEGTTTITAIAAGDSTKKASTKITVAKESASIQTQASPKP